MLEINLLPQKEKEQIISKRISLFSTSLIIPIIILIFVFIALLFFLFEYFSSTNKSLDSQITTKQAEIAKYSEFINKVNEYNKTADLVNKLSESSVDWPAIFTDMANQTPENLQINKFTVDTKNKNKVIINGFADSYRTVMLFKDKLDNSEQFKNASFTTGTLSSSGVVGFEMSCEFKKAKLPVINQQNTQQNTKGTNE